MKITREALKTIVKETMIEESEYQEFFKRALEKAGKSIPDMSDEEKKKFFNNIEKTWKGKGAKNERFGRGDETELEEAEYQEFFKKALEKAGGSIPKMSEEEKKAFFNKIEKTWKGKGAKNERFGRGEEENVAVIKITDELEEAQSPAQKAAFAKMLAKKDGKDESTDDEKEEVKESIIKEGFATWEMSFSDMNLNGVKLSKKNKYKVKARNTVEAIKKAAKMAGLKGEDWIATKTDSLKRLG